MDCHIRFVWFHRCLICDLRMGFYIRESGFSALESDMLHHHVAPPCFWRAFPTSCVFITATVSWLQFETSLLMPHRHITKHPPLFPLSPSQRLVPDSDVRLLCMDPAGGRGIVRSGPHTALDRTRPSKIKPTLLSASHNPQGGDDLDCPVKSMWSLLFLPKPCVCVFVCVRSRGGGRGGSGRWHCTGIAWSAKGSNEWAKDTPPPTSSVVPVFWEVFLSGWNSSNSHGSPEQRFEAHQVQVKGWCDKPSRRRATGETTSRSLPCLLEWVCECE